MQRVLLTFSVVLALWLAVDPARVEAEELGSKGNLVFSAERLFGVYFDHLTVEETNTVDRKFDTTVIGLGWSSAAVDAPLLTPRLGIDYFLGNAFTLGGSIGFLSFSRNDYTTTTFLLSFRAGYALRLGHSVSLWPRAGFSYYNSSYENSNADTNTFAITIDAPFAFALTEGFALTLGPVIDLGFIGERADSDATETMFGLSFGLAGWTNL
ncbi:MAG TPA: hypothetical protein VFN67_38985 [Polyangiales bacterium]|nr:hypothetical protein [Polyangiales bacterium]